MFAWLKSLFDNYLQWSGAYLAYHSTLGDSVLQVAIPILVTSGIILGLWFAGMIMAGSQSNLEKACAGLFGSLVGGGLGLILSWLFASVLPILIGLAVAVPILLLASHGVMRSIVMVPRWRSRSLTRVRRIWTWSGRAARRFIGRLKPKDYLAELDESAKEVQRRKEVLERESTAAYKRKEQFYNRHLEAQILRGKMSNYCASAGITDEVIKKLNSQLVSAMDRYRQLREILSQVTKGQEEMQDLISLARLCRQADQEQAIDDGKAIAAARAALDGLRAAFEKADAVLSEAVAVTDMNLNLAFDQMSEGVRRSTTLEKAADQLVTAPAVRVRT